MISGLKMWPLEFTQGKKLTTDDARRTRHNHNSSLSTLCSGKLTKWYISTILKLLSANPFNLVWSTILSFGKELTTKLAFETLSQKGWLVVVLGFNATLAAKVISWQSVTHMCFLAFSHQYQHNFSFQSHRLLFSHASAEVRGKNTLERKVASTGDQTQNHQVMSTTHSPLSYLGGAVPKGRKLVTSIPSISQNVFYPFIDIFDYLSSF